MSRNVFASEPLPPNVYLPLKGAFAEERQRRNQTPDIGSIRVGGDYYIVHYYTCAPGRPIWHSRDLIHWPPAAHMLKERAGGGDLAVYEGQFYHYGGGRGGAVFRCGKPRILSAPGATRSSCLTSSPGTSVPTAGGGCFRGSSKAMLRDFRGRNQSVEWADQDG